MSKVRWWIPGGMMLAIWVGVAFEGQSRADDPPAARPPVPVLPEILKEALGKAADDAQAIEDPQERTNALLELVRTEMLLSRPESARPIAAKAAEAANADGDETRRWRTLLQAAQALAEAGDREAAVGLIRKSREEVVGIFPPETTAGAMRSVAETSARCGDLDFARDTADLMEARARAIQEAGARIKALQAVAKVRVFIGDYPGALKFALEGEKDLSEPISDVFLGLVQTLSNQMAEAERAGNLPSPEETKPRREFLLAIARAADGPGFEDHPVDGVLVSCLSRLGDLDEARRILGRMGEGPAEFPGSLRAPAKVVALSALGRAQARAGQVEEARATFRQAVEWLGKHPELNEKQRDGGLVRIVIAQADLGDLDEAIKTTEMARMALVRSSAFMEVAHALEKKAWRASRVPDGKAVAGMLRRALREAEAGLQTPESPADADLLWNRIAIIRTKLGDHEGANEAFQKITAGSWKNFAASGITKARIGLGDWEGAARWANSLADRALRAQALYGIGQGLAGEPL